MKNSVQALAVFCAGVVVSMQAHADVSANLLKDGGFENGVSGLDPEDAAIAVSSLNPISGRMSLGLSADKANAGAGVSVRVAETDFKNSIVAQFKGTLRAESGNTAKLEVCVYASYFTTEFVVSCQVASTVVGAASALTVQLPLDILQPISGVGVSFRQQGGGAVRYTIDDTELTLETD